MIDERRRQREYNTNEAIQNLAKINAELSNKDKLIQQNENSRNPLNEGFPNYPNQNAYDKNRSRERDMLDERRRQREYNTNEEIQNLAKINENKNNKDRLIELNENSRNHLNDGLHDYQYQRFKDEYEKRQKMINDNINKFYPKLGKERSDVDSYYDNYVNNPNYNRDNRNEEYNK